MWYGMRSCVVDMTPPPPMTCGCVPRRTCVCYVCYVCCVCCVCLRVLCVLCTSVCAVCAACECVCCVCFMCVVCCMCVLVCVHRRTHVCRCTQEDARGCVCRRVRARVSCRCSETRTSRPTKHGAHDEEVNLIPSYQHYGIRTCAMHKSVRSKALRRAWTIPHHL